MSKDVSRATPRDASREHTADAGSARPADAAHSGNGDRHVAGSVGGNGASRPTAAPPNRVSAGLAAGDTAADTTAEPVASRHAADAAWSPEARGRHDATIGAGESGGGGGGGGLRVHLEFDFPSDVGYIERIVSVVIRQCEEFGFPTRQCALNVPVALTEALSNAILRGNGDDRSKQVRVRAHVDDRSLVMEIADEGSGFDYTTCMRDPTAPENIAREDGRGLYLMQRLMDRVERFSDHGNVVRMTLNKR